MSTLQFDWDNEIESKKREKILTQLLQRKDIKIDWKTRKNAVELVREMRDR